MTMLVFILLSFLVHISLGHKFIFNLRLFKICNLVTIIIEISTYLKLLNYQNFYNFNLADLSVSRKGIIYQLCICLEMLRSVSLDTP